MTYQTNQQWRNVKARALKRQLNPLPKVEACIEYVEGLGYALISRGRTYYIFRDVTGKRPLHNREMVWNLNEMRHAVQYGC